MKRTPLNRKTPLKPGKKRLAPISKQNNRPFQDKVMQAAYKESNNSCELTALFRRILPSWPIGGTLDLHHIRKPGRVDVWSNMIRVCRSIHQFDDNHPVEMLVACLWVKWKKGELNLVELDKCGVGTVVGWLDRNKPKMVEFVPLWQELKGLE